MSTPIFDPGSCESICGKVPCAFKRACGIKTCKADIPANCTAAPRLPEGGTAELTAVAREFFGKE